MQLPDAVQEWWLVICSFGTVLGVGVFMFSNSLSPDPAWIRITGMTIGCLALVSSGILMAVNVSFRIGLIGILAGSAIAALVFWLI